MHDSSNIAARLSRMAELYPENRAVVQCRRDRSGRMTYRHLTISELDQHSDRLARGLVAMGVTPGTKLVVMVPPGLEFFALAFAAFKAGAIVVLIDPGMGRSRIFDCLEEIQPDGFIGVPLVHVVRSVFRKKFPRSRFHVTVGRRWFWGGRTYNQLLNASNQDIELPIVSGNDPAAIIFTSGSTGPPKGVLYEHGMFNAQVEQLQSFFDIQPGEVDLAAFPLFALFDAGMGVTSVIPDMNPTRPADVAPENILEPIRELQITQAFGSPALWNRVGKYCVEQKVKIPHLRRIISAGAPLPLPILKRMHSVLEDPQGDMFPPYGATESLPIACVSGREMVGEIGDLTVTGAGTCVGQPFSRIDVRIINISETPIESSEQMQPLPPGEIGEITVRGPVVTREYYNRPEATRLAKVSDNGDIWHRVGDVGYFDDRGRLWFCGRKAHIVYTSNGPLYTEQCEPVFNEHPRVYRTALVGVGPRGSQSPVLVVEPEPGCFPQTSSQQDAFREELKSIADKHELTQPIETFLFHKALPVDIRHNVKINREQLATWADTQLKGAAS